MRRPLHVPAQPERRYDHAVRRRDSSGPLVLAAAALSGALALAAAPAVDLAAGASVQPEPAAPANKAPLARLRATPASVLVGSTILLDGSRSRDPDGHVVRYMWDLNGDGTFETGTGTSSRLRDILATPGPVNVGLRVIDNRGAYSDDYVRLSASALTDDTLTSTGQSGAAGKRLKAATQRKGSGAAGGSPARVRAAAATIVTVRDFLFAPKAITVHVGDTVTWINHGPAAHSATADDGSFDTGLLKRAASGSFRFTKAGTFSYHCTPHPFMKATVVVAAASGTSAAGSGSTTGGTTASGGTGSSTSGSSSNSTHHSSSGLPLPHTGLELSLLVAAGLALLGGGVALRRRLARRGGAGVDA